MAVIYDYTELLESQQTSLDDAGGEVTREYIVRWYNTATGQYVSTGVNISPEQAVIQFQNDVAALGTEHPLFMNPFITLQEIRGEPFDRFAKVFATWRPKQTQVEENSHGEVWKFSLGTQETNIRSVATEALQTHFPSALAKYNVGQGINVDDVGNVNGVSVRRPSLTITVSKKIPNSNMDVQSGVVLDRLNTVNSDALWSYSAGEVLFLGAEISKTATDEWTFVYSFEAARKQVAITYDFADGTSEAISVEPWQYLWFTFRKPTSTDGDGNQTVQSKIESLHIATVYETSVFAAFNLSAPDS